MKDCGLPKGCEGQCCLNHEGVCTLDTAEYKDIDRATGMRGCGFIGVNDRYLMWKYGVVYKDFNCGHCRYYKGETHGECTNKQVEPHTKGVKENGVTVYSDSKEYYSGAHACKEFIKKEEEKNCYRCLYHESYRCRNEKKCPDGMNYIEYTGSSVKQCLCATTEVYQDGYIHCPILESIGCEECMERFGDGNGYEYDGTQNYERKPRREEVKEVAKRTYWTKCGHEFEKNSTATVTGFEIPDSNERIISGICAACPFPVEVTEGWGENKKHVRWECRAGSQPPNHETTWRGSLDDKNTIQIDSLDHELMEEIRQFCIDHPELGAAYNADCMADCRRTLSISCSQNKKGIAAKHELIEKFFQDDRITQVRNLLSTLIGKEIRTHYNTGGIVTNVIGPHNAYGPGSWTINYTEDGKKRKNPCIINSIKVENGIITCDGKPLQIIEPKKDDETCEESQKNTGSVSCVAGTQEDSVTSNVDKPTVMTAQDSNDTKIQTCATCQANKEDCQPYQACMSEGLDPEECVCNNWSGKAEGNKMIDNTRKTAENDDFLPENVTKNDEIVTFDYSSVDEETGAFLQEKAARIMEIRFKSIVAIGKELKEAHERLANNKTGTFEKWVESIGITHKTSRNYINGYEYILKNFQHIEDANSIQPSLLFAVSKPSARPELQEAVLSGDITSHKQYKELEEKLRIKEQELTSTKEYADKQAEYADEHMMRARKAEFELEKNKKSYESLQIELRRVQQQFEQAKRNSDPSKIQELGQIISEKQREIEDLHQQLMDKPIEATASKVIEVIPEDIEATQYHLKNYAKVNTVLEMVESLSTEEMQSWAKMMNDRQAVNDADRDCWLEVLTTVLQNLQDMEDDYRQGGYGP